MYLVSLEGNPNVPRKEIFKALVLCYGKSFFKKFPKALKHLEEESEKLSRGLSAALPMSEDCWGRLGDLNSSLRSRGKAAPVNLVRGTDLIDVDGELYICSERVSNHFLLPEIQYYVQIYKDENPVMSAMVRLHEEPRSFYDVLVAVPFFWKIMFYKSFIEQSESWKNIAAEAEFKWGEV